MDEWWGRVCGIETQERVVRTPFSVICTRGIVFERINVLDLLTISSHGHGRGHTTAPGGKVRFGERAALVVDTIAIAIVNATKADKTIVK